MAYAAQKQLRSDESRRVWGNCHTICLLAGRGVIVGVDELEVELQLIRRPLSRGQATVVTPLCGVFGPAGAAASFVIFCRQQKAWGDSALGDRTRSPSWGVETPLHTRAAVSCAVPREGRGLGWVGVAAHHSHTCLS